MTQEQYIEAREKINAIIGKKDDIYEKFPGAENRDKRMEMVASWDRMNDKLLKIFEKGGASAIAMTVIDKGAIKEGITASGKRWQLYMNSGYTARSRYCGSLWIEGEGTVFTSGSLAKVMEYVISR